MASVDAGRTCAGLWSADGDRMGALLDTREVCDGVWRASGYLKGAYSDTRYSCESELRFSIVIHRFDVEQEIDPELGTEKSGELSR